MTQTLRAARGWRADAGLGQEGGLLLPPASDRADQLAGRAGRASASSAGSNARDMGKVQRILTDLGIRMPETTKRRRELEKIYTSIERNNEEQTRLRRQYTPSSQDRAHQRRQADASATRRCSMKRAALEKRKDALLNAERPAGLRPGGRCEGARGTRRRGAALRSRRTVSADRPARCAPALSCAR